MITLLFRFLHCLFYQSHERRLPNAHAARVMHAKPGCLLMYRIGEVPDYAGNMGVAPYHAISCFAFTVPRLHHSFSVTNSTVVFLCRNVATLNACTDDIFSIFIYMYLTASVLINMFMSIGLGHFHLICSKCDFTNFYF